MAVTIKELRLRSGMTRKKFATLAGVSDITLKRAELMGKRVTEVTAYRVLKAFETVYDRKFEMSDLDIKIR